MFHYLPLTIFVILALCFVPIYGWFLGPFYDEGLGNPILTTKEDAEFSSRIQNNIQWEEKSILNPTAVVRNNEVILLFEVKDHTSLESRIGLAKVLMVSISFTLKIQFWTLG